MRRDQVRAELKIACDVQAADTRIFPPDKGLPYHRPTNLPVKIILDFLSKFICTQEFYRALVLCLYSTEAVHGRGVHVVFPDPCECWHHAPLLPPSFTQAWHDVTLSSYDRLETVRCVTM